MSEEKTTSTKRTTKKAVAVTEAAQPKKVATAPKAKPAASKKAETVSVPAKAVAKAPAASKAATSKPTSKAVAAESVATKPGKAMATAKAVGKAPIAAKSATAKPADEAKKKASPAKKLVKKPSAPSQEERMRWIATAAYHRAEKRGFAPGYEVQDWLDAEAEIDELVGKA